MTCKHHACNCVQEQLAYYELLMKQFVKATTSAQEADAVLALRGAVEAGPFLKTLDLGSDPKAS